jgi:hypothetical protein
VWGAVLGAAILTVLQDYLQTLLPKLLGSEGNFEIIVFGVLMVVLLQYARQGVWPFVAKLFPRGPRAMRPSTPIRCRSGEAGCGRAAARGRSRAQAIRRAGGRERRELRRESGADHRADRAERRRQVDHVQSGDGRARRPAARSRSVASGSTGSRRGRSCAVGSAGPSST